MKQFVVRILFFILSFFLVIHDASSQVNTSDNASSEKLLQKLIEHPRDSILNRTSNEKLSFVNAFITSLGYVLRDKKRLNDLSAQLQYFIKNEKNEHLKVLAKYLHFNVLAAAGLSAQEKIPILIAVQKDAKETKDELMLMQINMDLGVLYVNHLKEYEKGYLLLRQNLDIMENSEMKQKPLHVLTVSYLTQLFLSVRDWNNALVYARKGLQLESTTFDKNSKLFLLQSIGLIYHRLNIPDSSDYYFQKMLIHAKEEKDSLSMYNAYGYIAENHIKKKEYLKALPLIEMQKKFAIQIEDPSLTAFDLLLEANIYFQLGNLGKSKALTYESEKYVYAANTDNTYKSFYTLMVKNLISAGDRKQGKLYLDSLFYMSEKIDTKINVVKGLKVEQLYTLDLVEKKAAIEQIANKKIHERNIYLIIIFLLSSLFVFLLYRNRQNKMRLLMLLEKQSLENELISVQDELAEFITKIDLQAKEIMHWNEEKITTPEEWNHFMELFSKTNPGFIQKVKDTLLGITPAELRFLCLSKVRITDIQMAVILGVNPNSVRQTRKRVKEKFGFETNESLMVLIEKI
jgi:DNA-binding CsgD family transcriptional regulator